jgi:hypothetical protein
MSEVVPDVQREFWRPPVLRPEAVGHVGAPLLADTCAGCSAEFVSGSRFCYLCGAPRSLPTELSSQPAADTFFRAISFQNVKQSLGLPLASLIAFFVGLGCILGAMVVGFVYSVETTLDFQALQLWRMEWLLGAAVAFVAGILLRTGSPAAK